MVPSLCSEPALIVQVRRLRSLATVLPISLLLLAACGGSAKEQARKLHQTEESWKATTRLTTELWKQGAIPAEYARQTLEAAAQGLAEARASAAKLSQ